MLERSGGAAERGSHAHSVPSERPCGGHTHNFEPQRVTCLHAIGCWAQWYLVTLAMPIVADTTCCLAQLR